MPWISEKIFQQTELFVSQYDFVTVRVDLVSRRIENERPVDITGLFGRGNR